MSSSSGSAILGNAIGGLNLTIGTQGVVTGDNFFEAVIDFNFSLSPSNTTFAVISNAGLITGNKPIAIDGADGFQKANIVNTGSIVGTGLGDDQICILGGSQLESLTITDHGLLLTADRITDFNVSLDRIDLSSMDTNTEVKADQAFTFFGTAGFSGDGQVRFFQEAIGNTMTVQVRVNVFATNMEIVLDGLVNLTAAQFDL